jgi:hypothetical protein
MVSGVIFAIVAALQAYRAIRQLPVQVGTMEVPVQASWIAMLVAGGLSIWAFRSARKRS